MCIWSDSDSFVEIYRSRNNPSNSVCVAVGFRHLNRFLHSTLWSYRSYLYTFGRCPRFSIRDCT
jgi:hypothetical protein